MTWHSVDISSGVQAVFSSFFFSLPFPADTVVHVVGSRCRVQEVHTHATTSQPTTPLSPPPPIVIIAHIPSSAHDIGLYRSPSRFLATTDMTDFTPIISSAVCAAGLPPVHPGRPVGEVACRRDEPPVPPPSVIGGFPQGWRVLRGIAFPRYHV